MDQVIRTHLKSSRRQRAPRTSKRPTDKARVREIYVEDIRTLELGGEFVRLDLCGQGVQLVMLRSTAESLRDQLATHLEKIGSTKIES